MRKHRTKVAVLVAIMLGAWGFQTGHAAGDVSCRASAVHVKGDPSGPLSSLDVELVVANAGDPTAPGSPCAAQTTGVLPGGAPVNGETLELPSGLGTVRAAWAQTTFSEFNSAGASAGVANVHLTLPGLPTIDAEVLTSSVTATCDENDPNAAPALTSAGEVARVSVAGGNDVWVPAGGASQSQDIAGLATLHLNKVDSSANSITRRALFLDTGLVDVTISEASVGFSGTPCAEPPPPTECNDDVDNADPEDELVDEADPGCHTDGDANNPGSYDPNDNDETDPVDQPECSDGVDNDDPEDTLVDMNDPGCSSPDDDDETDAAGPQPECSDGVDNDDPEDTAADTNDPDCHSDFDPNNPDSYDPNDDSEGCDEVPPDPESSRDSGDQEDDLGDADDEDCQGAEGPKRT